MFLPMNLGAQDYERCVLPKYLGVFSVRTQRAHFLQVTDGTKSQAGVLISEVPKCHTVLRNDSPREPRFYCWSVSLSQTVINQVNVSDIISLLSTYYPCYFGVNCKSAMYVPAKVLQVRRSAADRIGSTPGLPPALALAL